MSWQDFISNSFLVKLAAAAAELVIGFFLGPLVKKWIMRLHNRRGVDEGVLTFTGSFVSIFIRILAVIIALGQIGADVTAVVGIFSAMGLGISLALKESMANVAGGLQILLTKPFKVGDYIACNGQEGTVMEIEIMFTTLKTFNNQLVVVPNSILVSNSLVNYSRYPTRRIVMEVPVSAFGDYETFRTEIQNWMNSQEKILKDPAPKSVVGDYLDNGRGMQINVVCYTLNDDYWDEKYTLSQQVHSLRSTLKLDPPVSVIQVQSK